MQCRREGDKRTIIQKQCLKRYGEGQSCKPHVIQGFNTFTKNLFLLLQQCTIHPYREIPPDAGPRAEQEYSQERGCMRDEAKTGPK